MANSADSRKIFVDTNVLVYANIKTSKFHELAKFKLLKLAEADNCLYISNQVIREYLSVLSKPDADGNRLSYNSLNSDVDRFRNEFRVVFENDQTLSLLQQLAVECPTGGKQIHDANIVATMLTYDIKEIITHNIADFKRFAKYISIETLE